MFITQYATVSFQRLGVVAKRLVVLALAGEQYAHVVDRSERIGMLITKDTAAALKCLSVVRLRLVIPT